MTIHQDAFTVQNNGTLVFNDVVILGKTATGGNPPRTLAIKDTNSTVNIIKGLFRAGFDINNNYIDANSTLTQIDKSQDAVNGMYYGTVVSLVTPQSG